MIHKRGKSYVVDSVESPGAFLVDYGKAAREASAATDAKDRRAAFVGTYTLRASTPVPTPAASPGGQGGSADETAAAAAASPAQGAQGAQGAQDTPTGTPAGKRRRTEGGPSGSRPGTPSRLSLGGGASAATLGGGGGFGDARDDVGVEVAEWACANSGLVSVLMKRSLSAEQLERLRLITKVWAGEYDLDPWKLCDDYERKASTLALSPLTE